MSKWMHIPQEPGWYWLRSEPQGATRMALVLMARHTTADAAIQVFWDDGDVKSWRLNDLPVTAQWYRIDRPEKPGR
jgi:hypothetical protein